MAYKNLSDFILHQAKQTPNKVYLQFEDEQITYAELVTRMKQAAKGFYSRGIKQGDKVCTMLDNSPEYIDVWFGLSMIGATLVPLNTHLKGEGLQYIIKDSNSRFIIVEKTYKADVEEAIENFNPSVEIYVNDTRLQGAQDENLLSDLLSGQSNTTLPTAPLKKDCINNILYTSGTTGPPKGVMLTDENYIYSAKNFAHKMVGATVEDVLFTTLPLFHINAQSHTVLAAIAVNGTIALERRFSASQFWQQIHDHKATIFNSLGAMIPILCKQPKHPLEQSHRVRLTACAATPKRDWVQFEKRFNVKIIEGYGLTETAGFCVTHLEDAGKIGSIGQPYPYVKAKVVDTSQKSLPTGEVGEFALKADKKYFMKGYYNMPEATAEAVQGGWFYTGDHVYADADNYYYFTDRKAQAIRRRGENISSWEVEKAIDAHPAVVESAVVGVPSELAEEDVKAYVVLKEKDTLTPEQLLDWCCERLAYFMIPRYVEFVQGLPKTATERIEKYKLKKLGINDAWDREAAGYVLQRNC